MSKPEINVTPLIDILLVLLIIFMVVTPVKPSRFEAKIPSESKQDEGVRPHPYTIVVQIDRSGQMSINREGAGTLAEVTEYLKNVFVQREANLVNERTVFVKAPKELDYGAVARVVDAVKMSGGAPISLQIDRLD